MLPLLLLFLLHHATSFPTPGPHITDVNILLPPKMTYPVEYRLQASDGCFKWYAVLRLLYLSISSEVLDFLTTHFFL